MRRFETMEMMEAVKYALDGGQALHVMMWSAGMKAPLCFRGHKQIGHLLDQDAVRLVDTAKRLGVNITKVGYTGTQRQHIDLCGMPLQIALRECEIDAPDEGREKEE